MLQSGVLPGTSTPHPMQGDGTVPKMTETSPTRARTPSLRGQVLRRSVSRRFASRWHGLRTAAAVALTCMTLGGCLTGEQFQKGYILPPGALEQIPIGASQDQVLIVMGTPSTVATLNGEVFYYISQRSERPVLFMNQRVVDQRVIAVYFDKNRQVQRLANYGLQDGKIFDFISRTTATSGQEMSYLAPLFKLLSFN
jgi:outer membrane protein assembly factor BamE (lipoprotein component of BamABCDE complex)